MNHNDAPKHAHPKLLCWMHRRMAHMAEHSKSARSRATAARRVQTLRKAIQRYHWQIYPMGIIYWREFNTWEEEMKQLEKSS